MQPALLSFRSSMCAVKYPYRDLAEDTLCSSLPAAGRGTGNKPGTSSPHPDPCILTPQLT